MDPKTLTDGLKAVDGIADKLAVKDFSQPVAKELGERACEIIRMAFLPTRMLHVVSEEYFEQFRCKVGVSVLPRLKNLPIERIIEPAPSIAVPALQGMAFTINEEPELAHMYANLLGTAMDAATADQAHPAFAEVIRQMNPDEARLILHLSQWHNFQSIEVADWSENPPPPGSYAFTAYGVDTGDPKTLRATWSADSIVSGSPSQAAGCVRSEREAAYLGNLMRLGLFVLDQQEGPPGNLLFSIMLGQHRHAIASNPTLWHLLEASDDRRFSFVASYRGVHEVTPFGRQFMEACLPTMRITNEH